MRKTIIVALLLIVSCSGQRSGDSENTQSGTPAPTQTTETESSASASSTTETVTEEAPPPAQRPPATTEADIFIDAVESGNPVVITGRARTFENNVVMRVRASDGTVVTETFTTSTGEMGHHNPFRGTLWLTRDPGNRITVEALEYSARDGSETNLVRQTKPFTTALVDTTLYFPDQQCTAVKPYQRRMPKSISAARLLLEALLAGPTAAERARGAEAAFPKDARVEGVNLRDGVVTVDFNERLQNVGGACRAQMIRQSVTATMKMLPGVKQVVIRAGGSEKLALQP